MNVAYKKVVLPCPTRWNSQFQCIKSIMDLKVALIALGTDVANISALLPCSKEFEVLSLAAPFLERFEEASVALSATKVPTIQKVIPALARIDEFLERALNSNGGFKDFANNLRKWLRYYFDNLGIEREEFCFAHFLDPMNKGVLLQDEEGEHSDDLKEVIEALVRASDEADAFLAPASSQEPEPVAQASAATGGSDDDDDPCKRRKKKLSQIHPGLQTQMRARGCGGAEIRQEIERYLQTPYAADGTEVLTWWKGMASEAYPKLSCMARRFLCIPAASAASERIFSDAGNTVTWKRTNLHVNNVERLVYVKENFKHVKISSR